MKNWIRKQLDQLRIERKGRKINMSNFFIKMADRWETISNPASRTQLIANAKRAEHLRKNYVYTDKDIKEMKKMAEEAPAKSVINVNRELCEIKGKINSAKKSGDEKLFLQLRNKERELKNLSHKK
ncbi:hypothetical protein MHBO_004530 [Bonamia ostreae]|uniref:Uncharacterized protein n=1 Tax=Bonamia ostreae TaxID=126728 RepID=A0ABV2ATK1_9EUKA